jgi:hypothetical protein
MVSPQSKISRFQTLYQKLYPNKNYIKTSSNPHPLFTSSLSASLQPRYSVVEEMEVKGEKREAHPSNHAIAWLGGWRERTKMLSGVLH